MQKTRPTAVVDAVLERKLRDEFTSCDFSKKEIASVIAAMWFECTVSLDMQFTMKAFDVGDGFAECIAKIKGTFKKIFDTSRTLTKVDAFVALAPLSRFYCSFIPKEEITIDLEIEPYFEEHPNNEGFYAVTTQGLCYLLTLVRSFFLHRNTLKQLAWKADPTYGPANADCIGRAICMLKGRGDSYATDQLLDEIRQRVIGRHMPPHALYNLNAEMALKTKDMYLVMREVDPDRLNDAHRAGSVPFLLALQDDNVTIIKEILLCTMLLAPAKAQFYDCTYGDLSVPKKLHKKALGYYGGEYVLVELDGSFSWGFGGGIGGAVGASLEIMKLYDTIGYNYVVGTHDDFRPSLHEVEFAKSNCF